MVKSNKTTGVPYHVTHYQRHKERLKEKARIYRIDNKDKIKEMRKRWKKRSKEFENRVKIEVLAYYGNGILACVRCGYRDIRALTLDHIIPIGGKNRRCSGAQFYRILQRENYPEGYQTLCANCQMLKMFEGDEWRTKKKENL